MNNFDLKSFLTENKLTTASKLVTEALNKPLNQLGPALEKKLKGAGLQVKIIPGRIDVPSEDRDVVSKNAKLAAVAFGDFNGQERMELVVNAEKLKDLEKIRDYFNIPSGEYGPDKDMGWVIKNVRNVNPGDITASRAEKVGNLGIITFSRAREADDSTTGMFGTGKVRTRNKE